MRGRRLITNLACTSIRVRARSPPETRIGLGSVSETASTTIRRSPLLRRRLRRVILGLARSFRCYRSLFPPGIICLLASSARYSSKEVAKVLVILNLLCNGSLHFARLKIFAMADDSICQGSTFAIMDEVALSGVERNPIPQTCRKYVPSA